MSYIPSTQRPAQPRRNRYKTSLACTTCRRRKLKCDGRRPACGRCQDQDYLRQSCKYVPNLDSHSNSFGHTHEASDVAPSPPRSSAPAISTSTTAEPFAAVGLRGADDHAESVEFASRVRATIDARLTLPAAKRRCPIPLTDAPLFGEGLSRNQAAAGGIIAGVDNVLPARKHADNLMSLYWRRLEPLEPLFDQSRFSHAYQALFTGANLECDEPVFCSTLNVMFALSTQLQESLPSEQRDEASKTFFQRAWSLLRPELIVWDSGSVDVVRCLLLMGRYLQCTRNLHQTWMAVSSAVRIAQNLGLHTLPTRSSSNSRDHNGGLGRQVWQCCASMDRTLSWTLGQISMTSLTVSPVWIDLRANDTGCDRSSQYAAKMAELNEITNYIMLSQVPTHRSVADSLGLPPLVRTATDMNAVAHIDERLNKFEKSLAMFWDTDTAQKDTQDNLTSGQGVLFGLRVAHARILLFRPFLARFCLPRELFAPDTQGLEERMLQSCAILCVENVQRMIAVVCDDCRPNDATTATLGELVLPWWHRIFYLYLATQHLIAAMMRPNVFRHMVVNYWDKGMLALSAHEHLSPSITRCISSFWTMWQKVADIQNLSGPQAAPETFQGLFQHLGFEGDCQHLFNFDTGYATGMARTDNFDWDPSSFLDGGENYISTDLI